LAINHFRGIAFCFLITLIFYVFLLFTSYGIYGVVFHGMSTPKSDVGGGALLFGFLLFGDA
jgi:hypothetical protein